MTQDWYLDEQLWQDFYHCMFSPTHFQQAEAQIAVLLNLIGQMPETVLDLACGPGRHALPLARSGCQVTAVDSSNFLLRRLQEQLAQHNKTENDDLQIELEQADMREFRRLQGFDLVVSLWTSFGYFDAAADNQRVLQNSFDNLKADGHLVIDTLGKEYLLRNMQPVHIEEYEDGSLLVQRPVLIDEMTRMDAEWLLLRPDNTVARTQFTHFVYTAAELRHILQQAGFGKIELYGNWDGSAYDLDAERLIAVAEK